MTPAASATGADGRSATGAPSGAMRPTARRQVKSQASGPCHAVPMLTPRYRWRYPDRTRPDAATSPRRTERARVTLRLPGRQSTNSSDGPSTPASSRTPSLRPGGSAPRSARSRRGSQASDLHRCLGARCDRGRRARGRERRAHVRQLHDPGNAVPDRDRPPRVTIPTAVRRQRDRRLPRARGVAERLGARDRDRAEPHRHQGAARGTAGGRAPAVEEPRHRGRLRAVHRATAPAGHRGLRRARGRGRSGTRRRHRGRFRRAVHRLRRTTTQLVVRPGRLAGRDGDPRLRVRLTDGSRTADRDCAPRARGRHLLDPAPRGVHRRRHRGARARCDDRPRRRHRLLTVHRDPSPGKPRRRDGDGGVDRPRGRDRRPSGAVRRHDRGDRDLRPARRASPTSPYSASRPPWSSP